MNSVIVGLRICINCLDADIAQYLIRDLTDKGAKIVAKAKLADVLITDDFIPWRLPAKKIILLGTPKYIESLAHPLRFAKGIVYTLSFEDEPSKLDRLLEEIFKPKEPVP